MSFTAELNAIEEVKVNFADWDTPDATSAKAAASTTELEFAEIDSLVVRLRCHSCLFVWFFCSVFVCSFCVNDFVFRTLRVEQHWSKSAQS